MKEYLLIIITGLFSTIGVLASGWAKVYFAERAKRKNTPSIEDKSMCYLEMDKICASIRNNLKADGAYLAYFHNGGTFGNGISMDKFTVVGEDYNDIIKSPAYKKSYSATMINYLSYAYHRLLVDNRFIVEDTEFLSDISFKSDVVRRNVYSLYMYIIKDPITDKPIGFFSLEYVNPYVMTANQETEIWKQQNRISKLLNITVIKE